MKLREKIRLLDLHMELFDGKLLASSIIGVLCVLLFVIFLYKRYNTKHKSNVRAANRLLKKIRNPKSKFTSGGIINYLRTINAFVFEELLLTLFEERGYKIKRNKRYTGDGGIDGTIWNKEGKKILIQAKRYTSHIKASDVEEFSKVVRQKKAVGGYFIHTGVTGKKSWATMFNAKNIHIISGNKLLDLIHNHSFVNNNR